MVLHTDGGARGNPGPSAIGIELKDAKGSVLIEIGRYIGIGTNNEAEYKALVEGMQLAIEKKASELECRLDSELVVRQLNGEYKVKSSRIKILHSQVKILEKKLKKVKYSHIKREQNKVADGLVNQTLDLISYQ